MNQVNYLIKNITQKNNFHFQIEWTDGTNSLLRLSTLRKNCPCAECVDEITAEQKLNPDLIPHNIRAHTIKSVGRYAISIHFEDGHQTGIYTYDRLRSLAEKESSSF